MEQTCYIGDNYPEIQIILILFFEMGLVHDMKQTTF